MDPQKMIVTGNPVDGFSFFGPFSFMDDVTSIVQSLDCEWWIADLNPASDLEGK